MRREGGKEKLAFYTRLRTSAWCVLACCGSPAVIRATQGAVRCGEGIVVTGYVVGVTRLRCYLGSGAESVLSPRGGSGGGRG